MTEFITVEEAVIFFINGYQTSGFFCSLMTFFNIPPNSLSLFFLVSLSFQISCSLSPSDCIWN